MPIKPACSQSRDIGSVVQQDHPPQIEAVDEEGVSEGHLGIVAGRGIRDIDLGLSNEEVNQQPIHSPSGVEGLVHDIWICACYQKKGRERSGEAAQTIPRTSSMVSNSTSHPSWFIPTVSPPQLTKSCLFDSGARSLPVLQPKIWTYQRSSPRASVQIQH